MTDKAPPASPRRNNSAAMQARRERILLEARSMLVAGGMDNLSLRQLAEAAGVAVGTIYSLIGRKEEVLIALYAELQNRLLARIEQRDARTPLDRVEAVAIESAALFREDEDYCRAAFLAIQHLDETWPRRTEIVEIFAIARRLLAGGFQSCVDAGMLRGVISVGRLADLTLQSYRMTWMEWACRQISIDQSLEDALANVHIILSADATEAFRTQLIG